MKTRWLRRALRDLQDAYSHVAADNAGAAQLLVHHIEAGARQLSQHPNLGCAWRVSGTCELVLAGTPFLLVYRVEKTQIVVLTMLHSGRRWPR